MHVRPGSAKPANCEEGDNKCLYIGTPWENDVITNRRNVDDFKEASQTIVWTLSARALRC
jgi:hypothetical protein